MANTFNQNDAANTSGDYLTIKKATEPIGGHNA